MAKFHVAKIIFYDLKCVQIKKKNLSLSLSLIISFTDYTEDLELSIYINRDVYTKVIILLTKRTLIRYKKKIFKLVLTGVTDYQKVNTTFPPSIVDNFYASLNILSSNQKDENQCILDVWNGGFAWNWENERIYVQTMPYLS